MNADEHFLAEFFDDFLKTLKNLHQSLFEIYVFGTMNRHQKIFERLDVVMLQGGACLDLICKSVQNFFDRVSGYKNPLALDAFANEIILTALGVRLQIRARMVDN